jgi:serralysin
MPSANANSSQNTHSRIDESDDVLREPESFTTLATANTTSVTANTLTGDLTIDGILEDRHWTNPNITYSFPTSASNYGSNYSSANEPAHNFEAFNATQKAAMRDALARVASYTNATFTEMTETDTQHATLRFGETDTVYSSTTTSAWTYHPNSTHERQGDGWYNDAPPNEGYNTPTFGKRAYATFMHELGHQIGIKHPHDTGGTLGVQMPAEYDNRNYTVMSYNRVSGGDVQSYMMKDIAALQHIYGANFNTNSGNTTYRWSPTTGQMSINGVGQGTPHVNKILMTIWDGNGIDTYDFSNYTSALTVDLNPGGWTSLGNSQHMTGALGEIANAQLYHGDTRSLIENAKGGSGNDSLTGNQAANVLEGGGGIDRLKGNAGNDTFLFRTAADTNNGSSFDTILDFTSGDKIDVSNIDADSTVFGLQDFTFAGSTSTLTKGRLGFYYDSANNRTLVEGNTDTDATSELKLALSGNHLASLSAADFVL